MPDYTVVATEIGDIGRKPAIAPDETWGFYGDMTATRSLKVAWGDRYTLLSEIAADGGEVYPYATGAVARAHAARIRGFGKCTAGADSDMAAYEWAQVDVFYSTRAE